MAADRPAGNRQERKRTWAALHTSEQQAITQEPRCKRANCPYSRLHSSPRQHGFCCNACKRGEGSHTRNCTGHGADITPDVTWQTTLRRSRGAGDEQCRERTFGRRPARPRAHEVSVLQYIRHLTARHGLELSGAAEEAWERFEDRLMSPFRPSPRWRTLRLFPHAQDNIPPGFKSNHVDVALRGVDGKSRLYQLSEVTGVDERVQAVVASQGATANCLLVAFERIEEEDLDEFSFVCHGATHRSVACCLLLAALVYPQARVHLTTRRTRRAAALAGLL